MTGSADRAAKIIAALGEHRSTASVHYDEVLDAVASLAQREESIGKAQIGGLVLWKRLNASTRWARDLMSTPEEGVLAATGEAFQGANAQDLSVEEAARTARRALMPLPGFKSGDALASAVIVALAPARMAVYDRRAHAALTALGIRLGDSPGRYARYMALVEQLRQDCASAGEYFSAREIDLALFTLGGAK